MTSLRHRAVLLAVLLIASAAFTSPAVAASRNETDTTGMSLLGSWSTHFIPSSLNGFGANIAVPAQRLNGTRVHPGGTVNFIGSIGPFTSPPYAMGGALRNGTIKTNILGGGMCSSATTMFNAAARAGLTILERHQHSLYISRYPVGLDATVWGTPRRGQNLVCVNDTGNDIVIKGYIQRRHVIFEVWGTPDGRTVTFSDPIVTNKVEAQMYYEYTDELAAGKKKKTIDNYDAFNASVTRTVTSASGEVIHQETYNSRYKLLNGTTLVGRYPGDPPAGTRILASEYPH
jgi:vancomycin resistance protein YoaR